MARTVPAMYILEADANNYAGLLTVDDYDIDKLEPFDGSPMADGWTPVRMYWETEGSRPIPDFDEVSGWLAFNERAVQALGDLLESHGELLPIEVEGEGAARTGCSTAPGSPTRSTRSGRRSSASRRAGASSILFSRNRRAGGSQRRADVLFSVVSGRWERPAAKRPGACSCLEAVVFPQVRKIR